MIYPGLTFSDIGPVLFGAILALILILASNYLTLLLSRRRRFNETIKELDLLFKQQSNQQSLSASSEAAGKISHLGGSRDTGDGPCD